MAESSTGEHEDGILLDHFGQQILPIYTQICFCFPITDAHAYPRVIKNLEIALEKLHAEFPWLAGRVVNEGVTASNSGVFKIRPRASGDQPRLGVKDFRNDASFLSMEALRLAGFPINALDEDTVAPRKTVFELASSPEVLLVQATLINEGLLLTFLGQHQAMDGIGQDHVIRLFSKACRNEDFTDEEREMCNLNPSNNIPLLDLSAELPPNVLDYQIANHQSSSSPKPSGLQSRPDCTWAYFSFSKTSLEALKLTAAATQPSPPAPESYISTDDALSAFIWKTLTSIRSARLPATTPSTFARAVDVRSALAISPIHPGFVQNMTYNTFPFHDLLDLPLGILAHHLRSKISPETSTLAHDTRALATLLSRSEDRSNISFAASLSGTSDVFFSSWAKMRCYEYDFGPGLGKAEAVRRTKSHPTEGLMYLMPRSREGEVGLVVCLSEEDMVRLRADEEFGRFAVYVG